MCVILTYSIEEPSRVRVKEVLIGNAANWQLLLMLAEDGATL